MMPALNHLFCFPKAMLWHGVVGLLLSISVLLAPCLSAWAQDPPQPQQPPTPGADTQIQPVTITPDNHAVYFVNYGRSDKVRTLWLKIVAGTDVTLLDETPTPLGGSDFTNWRKIWDKPDLVIFEALGVKPSNFVALRVDGTFSVKEKSDKPGIAKMKPRDYKIYIWDLDLDGDTDQSGTVERSDDEEEREEKLPGVICLPNWDDDDGDHIPDCCVPNGSLDVTDIKINGTEDRKDFRELIIQRIPKMPAGTRVVLRFQNAEDAKKVRVFDEKDKFVLGPDANAKFKTEFVIPNIEASNELANETLTYLVEGILPGEDLLVELVAQLGQGSGSGSGTGGSGSSSGSWSDVAGARDAVRIMVAPFLLAPNERPPLQVVIPPMDAYSASMLPPKPEKSEFDKMAVEKFYKKHVKDVRTGPASTFFWQDPLQYGYASVPGKDGKPRILPMVAKLCYVHQDLENMTDEEKKFVAAAEKAMDKYPYQDGFQGSNPKALLAPDRAVFEPVNFTWDSNTNFFGGNIEISWPKAKDAIKPPYGRLGLGAGNTRYGEYFEKKQRIQLPIGKPDLEWLLVKHIDEIVMFLKGKDVTMPDVNRAKQLLSDWLKENPLKADQPLFFEGAVLGKGAVKAFRILPGSLPVQDAKGNELKGGALVVQSDQPLPPNVENGFVHFYSGSAKYQTYRIVRVLPAKNAFVLLEEETFADMDELPAEENFYGHLWRSKRPAHPAVKDQFYFVEAPMCILPVRVVSVGGGTVNFFNPITLTIGELLDTKSAGSDKVSIFWKFNAQVQTKLDGMAKVVDGYGPSSKIKLPVLFWNPVFGEDLEIASAFTPNLNNGTLLKGTFGAPKPFVLPAGPKGGDKDLFAEAASADLKKAGYELEPVHDWYVWHLKDGEVHCAGEVLRDPDPELEPPWWKEEAKP